MPYFVLSVIVLLFLSLFPPSLSLSLSPCLNDYTKKRMFVNAKLTSLVIKRM